MSHVYPQSGGTTRSKYHVVNTKRRRRPGVGFGYLGVTRLKQDQGIKKNFACMFDRVAITLAWKAPQDFAHAAKSLPAAGR